MAKIASKGTAFKWTISSVLTTIAQVRSIESGESKAGMTKVTALDSSVGDEYIGTGYIEFGQPKISGFFDPAASTHKALTADHTAIASRAASIAWPDTGASSWTFTAFCESFKANSSEGNPLQFDAGFRISGSTTFPT